MPELVLGPVHRFVGETDATMWVEIDKTVPGDPHPRLERVSRRRPA